MPDEEAPEREPIRIRLEASSGEGLTRSSLHELEARAAAGDAEAQAELDALRAEWKRALTTFQPALRAQLDKIAKTIAPLDMSKFYKASDASAAARKFSVPKIPPLVQEAIRDAPRFEVEPLDLGTVGPRPIVREVVHDVRMALAIERLNEQLAVQQKRGDRWQAAAVTVGVLSLAVAVLATVIG